MIVTTEESTFGGGTKFPGVTAKATRGIESTWVATLSTDMSGGVATSRSATSCWIITVIKSGGRGSSRKYMMTAEAMEYGRLATKEYDLPSVNKVEISNLRTSAS